MNEMTAWESEVRDWLATTVGPRPDGPTAPDLAVFRALDDDAETAFLDRIRAYRRHRFDAGYGALTLAPEHGGRGLSASFAAAFTRCEQEFDVPLSTELISATTGLVAPAIALYGSPAQRKRFLTPLLRTDLLACQLFSEPGTPTLPGRIPRPAQIGRAHV